MTASTTVLAERFELGDWLGEGSLSVVHEALDRHSGRVVAVKRPLPYTDDAQSVRRRFEREAAALSVIASAHVVELISAGTDDADLPYLVLERLEGRDLQEILDEHGPLKPARVARFLGQAAAALELAHGLGIVHRDLKPANLFVHLADPRTLVVKVLDFGMVVDTAGPTERGRDAFGGTPIYMAPEQVRGQLTRIGPATDIWGLAIVALSLLTAESCWMGSSSDEVMREIEASPIEPPSKRWTWLPEAFDLWFARSTRRVPERRFLNVAEQTAALAAALEGVVAPDHRSARSSMMVANTIELRTPSVLLSSGRDSALVGRDVESVAIEKMLEPGTIVTLTGTSGVGKTRLARAMCDALAESYVDGTWFVPLGAGAGAEPILGAIAAAMDLASDNTRPPFEHLVASLEGRHLLLVIDGIEQVTGAAGALDRLRASCPDTSWLVTSRLTLDLPGERCLPVEPLEVPGDGPIDADEAETFASVDLFVRRAREVLPTFELDEHSVNAVVGICRAVDGFPLGIELAAGQMRTSSPAAVRIALERTGRDQDAEPDHTSVWGAVAWSYGLLSPTEQRVLRHLAVLPDGLTFSQLRALLGHLGDNPAGLVMRLVQSHLVSWSSHSQRRLVMLDTVRELCRDRAARAGEDAQIWNVARTHAEEVARWDPEDAGGQEAWLARVGDEHGNLRAVLEHLLDHDPAGAMRLAGQLAWYWYLRGHYREGAHWLEQSIARSGATEGPDLIRALHGAGRLALLSCRYQRAEELLERARDLANAVGDERGEANAVQLLGSVARERGDYARARAQHQRGLDLWIALGDDREAARADNYLAFAAWLAGEKAPAPSNEPELRDPEALVWSLLNRGADAHYGGDRTGARELLGRAFAEAIATRFSEGIAWSLDLIGLASFERGELVQARAQLAASLRVHRQLGDLWRCASVLEALAAVAVAATRPARGAMYLGAADAIRTQIETPVPRCERALLAATERAGIAALGEAFSVGRERGRRIPLDQIVTQAREIS